MGQVLRESIRDWLRYILPLVPVDTGMAKASFLPLGRALHNIIMFGIQINPKREPYYSKLEGGMQSIDFGIRNQDFEITDDKTEQLRFVYSFRWVTDTLHWFLRQYHSGTSQVGVDVIEAADAIFWQVLVTRLEQRLPEVADYIGF